MTTLIVDFETRSRCDLIARGLSAYARDPSTSVLMMGWAIDDADPRLWIPSQSPRPPAELREAMRDPAVVKLAWNAAFEMAIMRHVLRAPLVGTWRDVMVMAYYASLPGRLEDAGKAIGLPEDMQKLSDGKRLIRKFSVPHKPSKQFPGEWRDETTDPEDWRKFCEYCLRDVSTERTIFNKLSAFQMPEHEWSLWELDQKINERGLPVDLAFVRNAARMTHLEKARIAKQFVRLTGLRNSTTAHLLPWARERGYPFNDLRKDTVKRALADYELSDDVRLALILRGDLSKNSTSKFEALLDKTHDERLTYSYQFGGASRTMRWAGRGVQPQNLPRPQKVVEGRLEEATDLVRAGEYDELYMRFGPVLPVLSSLVRSSFRAPSGRTLAVADLNAIENRVLGWLARCRPTLEVFEKDLCPYKSFGVRLYETPYEQITKEQRTGSKPAVLGAGYRLGGGEIKQNKAGDLVKTGLWGYAENMGIKMTQEEAHRAVRIFRETYPAVVQLWYDLEEAAHYAVTEHVSTRVGYIVFDYQPGVMRIRLPSGRHLHYLRPAYKTVTFKGRDKITGEPTEWQKEVLFYDGMDSTPGGNKRWARLPTHGGKLTENCLSGDSEVLTPRGWVPIVEVSTDDLVWDGLEWVRHDGLAYSGIQPTVDFGGVRMTPDHLVFVNGAWIHAEDCSPREAASTFQRYFRLPFRNARRGALRRLGRPTIVLESEMRLRPGFHHAGIGTYEGKAEVLRLCDALSHQRGPRNARHVTASGVRRLVVHARSVRAAVASRVAAIRRAWDQGVQEMADFVLRFLARHGADVRTWTDFGSYRQQPWVQPQELSMGYAAITGPQYACESTHTNPTRTSPDVESGATIRHRSDDIGLSRRRRGPCGADVRPTGRYEQVFDIVNAGPRHRFTVRGADGRPFLVHNCVQAIARDVLGVGLMRAKRAGFEIIGHAHDEIITEVDAGSGHEHERLCALMAQPIRWAPGLPLKAAGYTSTFYKKD